MKIEDNEVRKMIRIAKKDYGLKYSELARDVHISPNTISLYLSGYNDKISASKKLQILCVIDEYAKIVIDTQKRIKAMRYEYEDIG